LHRSQFEIDHPEMKPLLQEIEKATLTWEPAAEEHETAEAEGKALEAEIAELKNAVKESQQV
jgi:hypothetical protein